MKKPVLLLLTAIAIFIASYSAMRLIVVEGGVGLSLADPWCSERGLNSSSACLSLVNSDLLVLEQALGLTLFLMVIISTVVNMEWRVAVAILAVCIAVVTDLTSPKMFIDRAIRWDLVLFLIGSMTLAGILRSFGVFRYLAVQIIRAGKRSANILVVLIAILSYVMAAVLDEVTSIVYVAMVVLEFANIVKVDAVPLLIVAVLATNTGSSALPVGNPIGIYLYYTLRIPMHEFVAYSLPLSLANLLVLLAVSLLCLRKYVACIRMAIESQTNRVEAFITHHYTQLNGGHGLRRVVFGAAVLMAFVLSIVMNERIALILTSITGVEVDGHTLLSFIPYLCIALTFVEVPPESVSKFLERSVEWSSIIFFIMLFMLSYVLTYTGVMLKVAYAFSTLSSSAISTVILMLIMSAFLSAFLDNLSVVVAFSHIAVLLAGLGVPRTIFFALLFGGTFGGSYTPIGSTANIVAISLAEKRRIRIEWGDWIRVAFIPTTIQMLISILWLRLIGALATLNLL